MKKKNKEFLPFIGVRKLEDPCCPYCGSELEFDSKSFSFYCPSSECIIALERENQKGDLEIESKRIQLDIEEWEEKKGNFKTELTFPFIGLAFAIYFGIEGIIDIFDKVPNVPLDYIWSSFLFLLTAGFIFKIMYIQEKYSETRKMLKLHNQRLKEKNEEIQALESNRPI